MPSDFESLYPFDGNFLDLNGHRYHYLDEGSGPALVMLHGNPTWSFYYRNLVLGLRESYRCIVPDHLGCGKSDKPQDYDYCLANHIENVKQLLDHLDVDRFTLVVHDWGGPIGLGVAVDRADAVQGLVVFNTTCQLDADYPWQIKVCRLPVIGTIAVRGFNAFARTAASLCATRRPLPADVKAGLLAPYNNWANRIATQRFVQDIPFEADHPTRKTGDHIAKYLDALKDKPALICWGMQDFCFTEKFLQGWQDFLNNPEIHRFDDAGHYVVEDAHEDILPLMKDFLSRQT